MSSHTFTVLSLALCAGLSSAVAIPQQSQAPAVPGPGSSTTNAYAPVSVQCPSTAINRAADGLAPGETEYIQSRKRKADKALRTWLGNIDSGFDQCYIPTIGLTTSGGGYRSLLNGAGVVQAFDGRDSDYGTSGLYQAFTYQAGLSGGAWLLSSIAGNDWPTISELRDNYWLNSFENSLFTPSIFQSSSAFGTITADISAKDAAGWDTTLVDPYGRILSQQLLGQFDGGVVDRLSSLKTEQNFTDFLAPYPIITALGVDSSLKVQNDSLQYEFTPHEFGSWEKGVRAFSDPTFLGTTQSNNVPVDSSSCITGYDNLGYVLGTSSDVFPSFGFVVQPDNSSFLGIMASLITHTHPANITDNFALYKNPWYGSSDSPRLSNQTQLTLADGGLSLQNNPIWPFLQPERSVSVLIVNDNSADTADNYPDGSEIRQTYLRAQQEGLTKMPFIPETSVFLSKGLNTHANFFGCDEADALTIVWLPNHNYTTPSNPPTLQLQYPRNQTTAIIANGNKIATQNDDDQWPFCLACAIQKKTGGKLPDDCGACFDQYCYKQ